MSESIIFTHANVFDGESVLSGLKCVWVEGGHIRSVTSEMPENITAQEINLEGKTLMPGLIDAHIHATAAAQVDLAQHGLMDSYIWIRGGASLEAMLQRGFTTVRDAGGLDGGVVQASEEGWIKSPRIYPAGKALSQTNGHGDFRSGNNHFGASFEPCACSLTSDSSISMICDGVSAVRKAAREQLRLGATQIKIMASGGITSPKDRVDALQFSEEEIAAIVDEAKRARTYVMAHAYTPEAIASFPISGVYDS